MMALTFLLLIWAIGLFYQREHRAYVRELRAVAADLDITNRDWRIVKRDVDTLFLQRAFNIKTRFDLLRYALPVVFFALILIVFGSWLFAFLYLAMISVKWFGTVTALNATQYQILLAGRPIWTETF